MPLTTPKLKRTVPFLFALPLAALFAPDLNSAQAQAASAFSGLAGAWSGEGTIALTKGSTEHLRCNANYAERGGGESVDLKLLCASASYHFDLRISLVATAGAVLGSWNEPSQKIEGGIAGTVSRGLINVTAKGQAFNAAVTVATRGAEQSVKIHADSGDLAQVAITLRRAR